MKKIKMVLITLFSVITFCFSSCSDDNVAVTSITLNKSTITLKKGSSETLLATIQPEDATNKNYVWKSSDQTVASVSSQGVVTALKAGTATISVTTEEGTFSASCKVDVIVDVSSLQLSMTQLSIIKGTVKKLDANILPEDATNKNVIWKSSDQTIASVSSQGVVTALKAGTATISVTTEEGTFSASCKVDVIVDVSSLQLSLTQLSIIKGTVKKLDANILPEDATNKNVIWKSSNESVVSVDNDGNVKALKVGNAIITAITEDQGIEAKCDVKVSSSEDIKYNPYSDSENW